MPFPVINPPPGSGAKLGNAKWAPDPAPGIWDDPNSLWVGLAPGNVGVYFRVEVASNVIGRNRIAREPGENYFYDDPASVYDTARYALNDVTWVDITSSVEGFNHSRGRGTLGEQFRPGIASLVVSNQEGIFNPLRGRAVIGNQALRPGRWVRFSGRIDITEEWIPLWVGRITSLADVYTDAAFKITSRWTITDALSLLQQNQTPELETMDPNTPNQTTSERVRYIWDELLGYNPDLLEVETGTYEMIGTTFPGTRYEQFKQAADAEGGDFFADKAGRVQFKNRDWLVDVPTSFSIGTVADGKKILAAETSWDLLRIANQVSFQRDLPPGDDGETPPPVYAENGASIGYYDVQTFTQSGFQNTNDIDLLANANAYMERFSWDSLRLESITIWPSTEAAARDMLNVEVGMQVFVTVNTGQNWSYSLDAIVNGVKHSVSDDNWEIQLRLDNADRSNPNLGGAFATAFSTAYDRIGEP